MDRNFPSDVTRKREVRLLESSAAKPHVSVIQQPDPCPSKDQVSVSEILDSIPGTCTIIRMSAQELEEAVRTPGETIAQEEVRLKASYNPRWYWNYDPIADVLYRVENHKLVLKPCRPSDSMLPNSMLQAEPAK